MSVKIEVRLLIDSGCESIDEAIQKFDEIEFETGNLAINTLTSKSKAKVLDYFTTKYIDEE
ncbi:hypothetical protein [Cytobacillus praedii]|uniref:Uncharacterized protein n=1 Tax=Cytobacillus praedii TaxID=1742358 RepID=A0A4R1ASU9_9BACI|nr:hypothetical protein [Cytobacillus praedii]TCJ00952.1 hypothetical protein E0Y62_26340 [Cytobacillus praedii]